MSELKVNKISPRSGTDVTLGDSGDTFTVPAGASIVNNGTATGFGATGAVNWDTTAKTTGFTAVSGVGYFCDTTSAGFTVTLPATPSAGDIVGLVDYAGTFDTNNLTIDPNGEDIIGQTSNVLVINDREAVTLVYVDSTQGWLPISGYQEGTQGLAVPYSVDFLVVAGGASGGFDDGGGGGAGGYRTSTQTVNPGTVITVTVGDGGATATINTSAGNSGSNSSISGSGLTTITSAGGGGGGTGGGNAPNIEFGLNGGSGGGGSSGNSAAGGSGNTPSTAPSQGNNGGTGSGSPNNSGGGGGAGEAGNTDGAGHGGDGTASSITGSSVTRAGGGGGSTRSNPSGNPGGDGGGGDGAVNPSIAPTAGTINTGSGGGGGNGTGGSTQLGAAGGKGVVILSMPLVNFSNTTTGSPTESDDGTTKVLIFNGSGSYTA
jgi:hypothetical protein